MKPPATADVDPGRNGFLVLLSRLAQVDMDVDEARDDDPATLHVEHLSAVRRQVLADATDHSVFNQDVELAVAPVCRIDHATVLEQ